MSPTGYGVPWWEKQTNQAAAASPPVVQQEEDVCGHRMLQSDIRIDWLQEWKLVHLDSAVLMADRLSTERRK